MVTHKEIVQYILENVANVARGTEKKEFFQYLADNLDKVEDVYVDEKGHPTVVFIVTTNESMRNGYGKVHGGALLTMIDNLSSMSQFGDPKYWVEGRLPTYEEVMTAVKDMSGVSRRLEANYLRPAPIPDDLRVECKLTTSTPKTSLFNVRIFDSSGKLVATGIHDKVKLGKVPKF